MHPFLRQTMNSRCRLLQRNVNQMKNRSFCVVTRRINTRKPVELGKKYLSTMNKQSYEKQGKLSSNEEHLIVIGSGVAGCSAALVAAETYKIPVKMFCAGSNPLDCNSYWAQGGIIYRNYNPSSGDSAQSLVKDVLRAGAGLCADDAVWKLSEEGPERIRQLLLDDGSDSDRVGAFANVPFDRDENGELLYCLEASHSAPRIIHQADQSGKAITEHITAATASHPLIEIIPNTIVTDLITSDSHRNDKLICLGAQCFDKVSGTLSNQLSTRGVVLATGGTCGIYEHSTNPPGFNALGSSIALAVRAGAAVADLEFIQFHPTSLYIPGEERFLLTEALRGAGAVLRDSSGYAFAKEFHEDGELAPRDVVARGVYERLQMKPSSSKNQQHNVFLDIRHRDAAWLRQRFPSIQEYLSHRRLDLTKDLLPITPAAHYTCGGVATDLNGKTNITGLYAAGEAARTGLHGGNRLASTSLLEGLVFGASVADYVGVNSSEESALAREAISQLLSIHSSTVNLPKTSSQQAQANSKAASWLLTKLRQTMWNKVGVVRTPSGTEDALHVISQIQEEASELFQETITVETAGLRDAAFSGQAVAFAAHNNRDSKGAHFIISDPEPSHNLQDNEYEDQAVFAM